MGMFTCGDEGDFYQARWCRTCAHNTPNEDGGCAVWDAHVLYCYNATEEQQAVLNLLIPEDEDGGNAQCAMWLDRRRSPDRRRG